MGLDPSPSDGGYAAHYASYLNAQGALATSNGDAGFYSHFQSALRAHTTDASSNAGAAYHQTFNGLIYAAGLSGDTDITSPYNDNADFIFGLRPSAGPRRHRPCEPAPLPPLVTDARPTRSRTEAQGHRGGGPRPPKARRVAAGGPQSCAGGARRRRRPMRRNRSQHDSRRFDM